MNPWAISKRASALSGEDKTFSLMVSPSANEGTTSIAKKNTITTKVELLNVLVFILLLLSSTSVIDQRHNRLPTDFGIC